MSGARVALGMAFVLVLGALMAALIVREFERAGEEAAQDGASAGAHAAEEAAAAEQARTQALLEASLVHELERGSSEAASLALALGASPQDVGPWRADRDERGRVSLAVKARGLAAHHHWMGTERRADVRAAARDAGLAAAAEAADRSRWRIATVVASGLLVVAGAGAWFLRRQVDRPLTSLVRVMDQVAGGGEARFPPRGTAPVQETAAAFNRMVDALSAVRRDLEERVDAKTAALATALSEQRELNVRLREVLQQLEATQDKLVRQEKMAALGTLSGGVAHEFNNILGGIRGCADNLIQELEQRRELDQRREVNQGSGVEAGGTSEERREAERRETLEVIARAARRGKTIVEGLMTFSRTGTSHEERDVDVPQVVEDVLVLLRPAAAERDVALITSGPPSLVVRGDPVEIHQVLLNLVQNAAQAAPGGSAVEVSWESRGDQACLAVSDRGAGIRAADRSRIFEPFFTTRAREGGTGLGLAISHGIVDGMGGVLDFEERDGGGTTFRLVIPRGGAS